MEALELRDYQSKGLQLISKAIQKGRSKILLHMATGGGKTRLFLKLTDILCNRNNRVLIVSRRKSVVFQTKKKYPKSDIFIASKKKGNEFSQVIVASIDTLIRCMDKEEFQWFKKYNYVLIDECHDCMSEGYQRFFEWMGDKKYIGFTATPYEVNGKTHTWWDGYVKPITKEELKELGVLVPAICYTPPSINLTALAKVKISGATKDYQQKQLFEVLNKEHVYGNIVKNYKKYALNKFAIAFCVNKAHSREVAKRFQKQGVPAYHCDADTPQKAREALIALGEQHQREGKSFVLCNCNVFSTGVDIPSLEVVLLCRPTKSKVLYFQQAGRGLRCFPKKENVIFVDFASNMHTHGDPYSEPPPDLEPLPKKKKKKKGDGEGELIEMDSLRSCPKCFRVNPANATICEGEDCGASLSKPKVIIEKDGNLVPYDLREKVFQAYNKLVSAQTMKGFSEYYIFLELYRRFGSEIFRLKKWINMPEWIYVQLKTKEDKKMEAIRRKTIV